MATVKQGREGWVMRSPGPARDGGRIGRRLAAPGSALALFLALWAGAPLPAAADQIEQLFGILDANGDGVIDPQEFQLRKTEIFFRSISNLDAVTTLGPEDTNLTPEAFAEADRDGDGRLSGAEFVQARFAQFELYDTDSDQLITFAEFEGFISQFLRD